MRGRVSEILKKAMEEGYAVGAFNTANLEFSQGIVRAAKALKRPCVIQVTPSSIKYAGAKNIGAIVQSVINNESGEAPVGFHLDHGKTFEDVVVAVEEVGMDSVMIDASTEDLETNIAITKRVVEYAHKHNVTVQAELGRVPYVGRDGRTVDWDQAMTNPEEAKRLIEETGADALAVGIGNAHGFFKELEVPDWKRLEKIKELIPNTPLIMHGASDWGKAKVKEAVARGIVCFNVDTDIRLAFINALCSQTMPKCDLTDPRKAIGVAREAVTGKVIEKIEMFKNAVISR